MQPGKRKKSGSENRKAKKKRMEEDEQLKNRMMNFLSKSKRPGEKNVSENGGEESHSLLGEESREVVCEEHSAFGEESREVGFEFNNYFMRICHLSFKVTAN